MSPSRAGSHLQTLAGNTITIGLRAKPNVAAQLSLPYSLPLFPSLSPSLLHPPLFQKGHFSINQQAQLTALPASAGHQTVAPTRVRTWNCKALAVINCMPQCPDFLSSSIALREGAFGELGVTKEGSWEAARRREVLEPLIRRNLTRFAGGLKKKVGPLLSPD